MVYLSVDHGTIAEEEEPGNENSQQQIQLMEETQLKRGIHRVLRDIRRKPSLAGVLEMLCPVWTCRPEV